MNEKRNSENKPKIKTRTKSVNRNNDRTVVRKKTTSSIKNSTSSSKNVQRKPIEELRRKKALREKKKRRKRILNILIFILLIISIIVVVIPISMFNSFTKSMDSSGLPAAIEPASNEPVNVLILGMDIGDVNQVENQGIKRTDTIMVLNYNPNNDKVSIISIPRDTMIEVDAYDGNGNLRNYWKMNAAYVLGGREEVIEHVEKVLDITVNYLVEIDYKAFRNFIDAIGGVEMYIEQDMYYDDPYQDLHINFVGGETVHLDGQKAEEFFRWRKNNDGTGLATGDLGRIQNQQKFIKEVIKKCLNPKTLMNMSNILDVIAKDIVTNMPGSKMMSYGFKGILNDGISMTTLRGTDETIYGESFLVVDEESNKEILDALKNGTTLSDISIRTENKILVLNGTRINGLAGELKEDLMKIGYSSVEAGNTQKTEKSVILSNDKDLRQQLKIDVGIDDFDRIKFDYENYDAVIIIGEDLKVY